MYMIKYMYRYMYFCITYLYIYVYFSTYINIYIHMNIDRHHMHAHMHTHTHIRAQTATLSIDNCTVVRLIGAGGVQCREADRVQLRTFPSCLLPRGCLPLPCSCPPLIHHCSSFCVITYGNTSFLRRKDALRPQHFVHSERGRQPRQCTLEETRYTSLYINI